MNYLSKQILAVVNDVYCVTESTLKTFYFASHDSREIQLAIDELVDFHEIRHGRNMLGKTLISNK